MESSNNALSQDDIEIIHKKLGLKKEVISVAAQSDFRCALCGFDIIDSARSYCLWNLLTVGMNNESILCCSACRHLLIGHKPTNVKIHDIISELREYIELKYQNKMQEVLKVRQIIRKVK